MSDWKQLRKQAEAQGWQVLHTNKGHLKWLAPDKRSIVVTGKTPSDHRALGNTIARLRRAGFHD